MYPNAIYRPLKASEVEVAADIFLESVADMHRRHGAPPVPVIRELRVNNYSHLFETGIFEVTEVDGRVVQICAGIVRGKVWFLSGFWSLPAFQRSGLGRALLNRVWKEGEKRGAEVFRTWSSIDATALAVYMRQSDREGRKLMPRSQIFTFSGALKNPLALSLGLELSPFNLGEVNQIDLEICGTTREVDHLFWKGERFILRNSNRVLGYFHATNGFIGPAAWMTPDDANDVISAAFHFASRQAKDVRFSCAGLNHAAIDAALTNGLRLTSTAHLLSTRNIGRMDQYLPSGALLF